MLPEAAFDEEIKAFIQKHKESNLAELLLKRPGNKNRDWLWIGQQIEGYQKSKQKIPSIANHEDIIYPKRLSLQQCSSDLTASFKAARFKGDWFLDLSGGFGIDTFHLSKNFKHAVYVEQDKELSEIMSHNCEVLGLEDKIEILNEKAEDYLKKTEKVFDLIYIDPARRDVAGKKVFRFSDCSPDVILMLDLLREKSNKILIKAAPMLDISQGVRELRFVEEVHVLANSRECKELLFVCGNEENYNPHIYCEQLDSGKSFDFNADEEVLSESFLGETGKYLYNPGPSISKAGGFKTLAKTYNLKSVHPNTHLFFSDKIDKHFPGRIHEVEKILELGETLQNNQRSFNLIMRNVNLTKKELMNKYGITEGNDAYLYCYRSTDGELNAAVCSNPLI